VLDRVRIAPLGQCISASPALLGKAVRRRPHLRRRQERTLVTLVASLSAARPAGWRILGSCSAIRWRVARRRLARVRRILAEPTTKLGVLRFQLRVCCLQLRNLDRLRLDETLEAGEPIFDAGHASVRSRPISGVDPLHAARRSGLHPVNAYDLPCLLLARCLHVHLLHPRRQSRERYQIQHLL